MAGPEPRLLHCHEASPPRRVHRPLAVTYSLAWNMTYNYRSRGLLGLASTELVLLSATIQTSKTLPLLLLRFYTRRLFRVSTQRP